MVTDIELRIPAGLTAAQIQRVNADIGDDDAQALAVELHAIIAAYRQLFSVRPPDEAEALSEEADMIATIWRTAMDMWPKDNGVSANESVWLMERLTAVGGDELYERYLRLSDRINKSDVASWAFR